MNLSSLHPVNEYIMELIRKYPLGFLLYGLVLIAGIILVASVPKLELHVLMNTGHTPFQDVFFRLVTWLGDGWVAVIISAVYLFVRFRYFFMLFLSFSVSGLLAQFLKRVVFPDALRPAALLEHMQGLETVSGVGLYHTLSFPSGHTTSAFAVLVLVGLISRNRSVFFLSMLTARCAGFSRVYLSQHFLVDVLAGSLLGTFSALFFYWYFQRLKPDWLDRSVLSLSSGINT